MEIVAAFFIRYFVLICLSIVMVVNSITHFRIDRRISFCSILITFCCILLAISCFGQEYTKPAGLYYWTLILSIFGYALRPTCLYIFIQMNKKAYRGKYSFLIWLPLVINLVIYLCALIPGTTTIIFGFARDTEDGGLSFMGGPLRFTSHIISIGYLLYLVYISVFTLRSKHLMHGITLLVCALFVSTAVVIETFFNDSGTIELLNTTIMVSTLAYYLFLYKEHLQVDSLTGLYNRETYYKDVTKMAKTFTGIIEFDVNGLKYINDNFGHYKGDECLYEISTYISRTCSKNMYIYRMGGDEFLVIANNTKEEEIISTIQRFKELVNMSDFHCSVGYACRKNENDTIDDVIKEAEKSMYLDKEEFYKNSAFERRKSQGFEK